jgi:glycosyltransferase involved in cell wall biosynthesis
MAETPTAAPMYRLSVIIPTFNSKGPAERAIMSVLSQSDPIGTEIIVADDGSRDGTPDYLEEVFAHKIAQRRLLIERFTRTGDPGRTRNRGVERSRGTFLAFLDPRDSWRLGRLEWLEPLLKRHDLILATDEPLRESSDWIRAFLTTNWAITSSAVIRRTLFDEVGGFPEGYFGAPFPKRLPGLDDYEFWLRCLITLMRKDQRDRFILMPNQHVTIDPLRSMDLTPIHAKIKLLREALTLVHIARSLPPRYWITLAQRLADMSKALVKRRRG